MTRLPILGLLTLALVGACDDGSDLHDSLAATPTVIVVGSDTVTIEGWANRDFMPVDPNDSLVTATTVLPADAPVVVEQVWVVRGDEVWRAAPSRHGTSNTWVAWYGPKWPIGEEVYIVAEIRHAAGGATQRVRSQPVAITESS
jgi:hypothetical protein